MIINKAGKSQAELARLLNKTPAVITNLFNGERELKANEVNRISQWLSIPVELVLGMKPEGRIPIIGTVGAGGEIFPIDDLPLLPRLVNAAETELLNCEWIECPPGRYESGIVAVKVVGSSMLPFMPEGTILYYTQRTLGGAPDAGIDRLCVVQRNDGATFVKIVRKSHLHARFDLVSYNHETMRDVQLAWCAPVIFIKPYLP